MKKLIFGDELVDYAKKITSTEEFEYFLKCLSHDYTKNQGDWENSDLLSYLDALSRYVPVMENYYQNIGENIKVEATWRMVAEILLAASVYEI